MPEPDHPTCCVRVNLDAVAHNVRQWQRVLTIGPDPPQLCGVVKQDGYGMGSIAMARTLEACRVRMLAVYSLDQAGTLLHAGIRTPLLVLMPVESLDADPLLLEAAERGQIHLAVDHLEQAQALADHADALGRVLPVHLHLDTGMSRAGMSSEQLTRLVQQLDRYPGLDAVSLFTHFATADDDARLLDAQMQRYEQAVQRHGRLLAQRHGAPLLLHAANTHATLAGPRYHLDMVRLGLGLLGHGPEAMQHGLTGDELPDLRPVLRWTSRLIHVQDYPAGATVGYGATFTVDRASTLGVVPVGYADGYPLSLSNTGQVGLCDMSQPGQPVVAMLPVRGKVNMDQIIVDLTDAPEHLAQRGAMVCLIDDQLDSPIDLAGVAEAANTSIYEIACRISPRLGRCYIEPRASQAPQAAATLNHHRPGAAASSLGNTCPPLRP